MSFRLAAWAAASVAASVASAGVRLYFEENRGQTDSRVEFLSRASGYVLFLDDGDAVLKGADRAVRMKLIGGSRLVRAAGLKPLPGRSNYLGGGESRNVTSVAQYEKVRYQDIYQGIDLVYYGIDGRLEFDFVVAPGSDPSQIRLRFDGALTVRLDEQGNLLIDDRLRFDRPVLYQEYSGRRTRVEGDFRIRDGEVSFHVGGYREDLPLIIDPVLSYSTYLGGSGDDRPAAVGRDSSGSVYIAGITQSVDFPATLGTPPSSRTSFTPFVAKLDRAGTSLEYSTFIAGTSMFDACVSHSGDVMITGKIDAPVTVGANYYNGAKVAQLNSSGSSYVFVAALEATPVALACGSDGSAYVTGHTSTSITTTPDAFQKTFSGYEAFVARFAAKSGTLLYSTYVGGSAEDTVSDITVDSGGNAYVVGHTYSTDFPIRPGTASSGGPGVYALKLNPTGSALVYARVIAPSGRPHRCAIGPADNLWVTGVAGDNFPVTSGAYLTTPSSLDYFLLRLDSSGTSPIFATLIRSNSCCDPMSLAVDSSGEAYVVGRMTGQLATADAFQRLNAGSEDPMIVKFNAAGSFLRYATFYGGSDGDFVYDIALSDGGIYLTGVTRSANLPVTTDNVQSAYRGGSLDIFIAKIGDEGVSCSYALTAASAGIDALGTTGTVGISTAAGCAWSAVTSASWITLGSSRSGVGAGTLTYTVAPNNNTVARTATVTVAGKNFTVSQAGATCTYSITPTSMAFDALGGASNISVTAPQGCIWTVVSSAPWLVPAVLVGNTAGTVGYTVAPNPGVGRTATLTIGGRTFTVSQGGSLTCQVTAARSGSSAAPAEGQVSQFAVVVSGGSCAWTAKATEAWVELYPNSGSTAGSVGITVYPNFGSRQRTATVTIGSSTFVIAQAGMTGSPEARFVRRAYFNALRRFPPAADEAFHVASLATRSKPEVMQAFLESGEFRAGGSFVSALYRVLLGRVPEITGWAFQLNSVIRDGTAQGVLAGAFLGTPEWRLKQGESLSDAGFVTLLYQEVLGRMPDSAELTYQLAQLDGSARTRGKMTTAFLGVPEFYTHNGHLLNALHAYFVILGRDPTVGELVAVEARLRSGTPFAAIVTEFVNSDEHINALQ